MITDTELYILSYYRASELAGGILFGKLAFHTDIDELRSPLTEHAQEETLHGWLWNKAILELGQKPLKVVKTYQTEYFKKFGPPKDILDVMALTQTLELRVMKHFKMHRDMENVNDVIKSTLNKMIEDEEGHLGWIKVKLDNHPDQERVNEVMNRLNKIDEDVYSSIMNEEPMKSYFNYTNG